MVIGIHPGTVETNLSKPFLKHVTHEILSPLKSVQGMLQVINKITNKESGKCFDSSGNFIDP